MKNRKRIEMTIAIVALMIVSAAYGPAGSAQTVTPRATKVRIDMRDIYGALFVTIAGTEKKVTDQVQQAWIINGGRHVVYSSDKGPVVMRTKVKACIFTTWTRGITSG